jgi:hypothetical protein
MILKVNAQVCQVLCNPSKTPRTTFVTSNTAFTRLFIIIILTQNHILRAESDLRDHYFNLSFSQRILSRRVSIYILIIVIIIILLTILEFAIFRFDTESQTQPHVRGSLLLARMSRLSFNSEWTELNALVSISDWNNKQNQMNNNISNGIKFYL